MGNAHNVPDLRPCPGLRGRDWYCSTPTLDSLSLESRLHRLRTPEQKDSWPLEMLTGTVGEMRVTRPSIEAVSGDRFSYATDHLRSRQADGTTKLPFPL